MIKATLPQRGSDVHGSGKFGAPRGRGRKHRGVDFAAYPGTFIYPAFSGTVTKVGFVYPDDLSFRYVEVLDKHGFKARYFYLLPTVVFNQIVGPDKPLGIVQKLGDRFEGITEHVHVEVVDNKGETVDPLRYLSGELYVPSS